MDWEGGWGAWGAMEWGVRASRGSWWVPVPLRPLGGVGGRDWESRLCPSGPEATEGWRSAARGSVWGKMIDRRVALCPRFW